jgi:hypothetical protein
MAGYDPWDQSSMRVLYLDAKLRKEAEYKKRRALAKAAYRKVRRGDALADMARRGIEPLRPRGRTDRGQSVAGKTIAEFDDLVDEWHPTANGALLSEDVPAGSGRMVSWICPDR